MGVNVHITDIYGSRIKRRSATILAVLLTLGSCLVYFAPASSAATNIIGAPAQLDSCTSASSPNSIYKLTMQCDGNLVLIAHGSQPVWASNTAGYNGAIMQLQGDGNLVVYSSGHVARWASGTQGHPGTVLAIQDDGNVVLVAPGNHPIWATNTVGSGDFVDTPRPGASAPPPTTGERLCKGWGGVLNNIVGAGIGALSPAILGKADLGTPYLDGNVVRADSSVPFYSWGSCGNQVEFQMQSWVCGFWGCEWVTRNHGTPEFFWAHDDTGVVSQQVTMGCRKGTHSYRVRHEGDWPFKHRRCERRRRPVGCKWC